MPKFYVDLTEKEYDVLMQKFGKRGKSSDGAPGAIKRLICFTNMKNIREMCHTTKCLKDIKNVCYKYNIL